MILAALKMVGSGDCPYRVHRAFLQGIKPTTMKLLYKVLLLLPVTGISIAYAQPAKKEKPPTQKEMEAAMKKAQGMMDEMMKDMSDEDKKMMDSMGIKMPNIKNIKVPKATDKQLADAWEDDMRIVPKKDATRIALIPKSVTAARMPAYIAAIQPKVAATLEPKAVTIGNAVYTKIKSMAKNNTEAGNMATAFWLSGQPDVALYVLGKICAADANHTNNLSNYASMLSMEGGQHLAIPVLQHLNSRFPRNSTLLNNLGQAWFGLGELAKAEKYLDSAIAIYPFHPQANLTKATIEEHKGNTTKAADHVKKSIKHSYSKEKEEQLNKLGQKLTRKDVRLPVRRPADPLGLEGTLRPDYPTSVAQIDFLYPLWNQFNNECDKKSEQIQKEMQEATAEYAKAAGNMASKSMAAIQSGDYASFGFGTNLLYMRQASLELQERKAYHEQRMKKLNELFMEMRKDVDAIQKNRKILAPEAPCSAHRDALNDMLKKLNERKKRYDEEALTIFRHYCNDMAYWPLYTSVEEKAFRIIQLEFKLFWLQKNRELQPMGMSEYKGAYHDCPEEEKGKGGKLAEFDDIACQFKSTVNMVFIEQENNCSHTVTRYKFKDFEYISRELGTKYQGGTIKMKAKASEEIFESGPLEVEAFIEGAATIELDENKKVKDWNGTVTAGAETTVGVKKGPVKAGISNTNAMEIEFGPKGVTGVNAIGKVEASVGAFGQKVELGVEDRVSLISGHGSVTQTGTLGTVKLVEW